MAESSATDNSQIARAAGVVMAGFVLSNLTGLVRQVLVSNVFGTQAEIDAFNAAARVPDTLFVLVAGGYSCILLGVFYLLLDIWKVQTWAQPFVWIGMNALTIYMASNIISFHGLAVRFVGNAEHNFFGSYGLVVTAILALGLKIGLVYFLYRKKVFIRA